MAERTVHLDIIDESARKLTAARTHHLLFAIVQCCLIAVYRVCRYTAHRSMNI